MRASFLMLLIFTAFSQQQVIDDLLDSISKGVTFFENQCKNINLDGVLGYVILQVQLQEATRSQVHSDSLSLSQRVLATSLLKKIDKSLECAISAVQETDEKYFKEFGSVLVTSFWSLPHKWSSTDPSLAYPSQQPAECYDELLSDKCMMLLLGTWKEDGTSCIVTKTCRDTMTQFGCSYYSLSHQLLYFMIGKLKGCSRMLKGDTRQPRVNITVEHYQRIFCSNMMKSNQEIFSNNFAGQMKDMFIENILLCGLAGFSDFYKPVWLQNILTWQEKDLGCFGKDEHQQMFEELLHTPHKRVRRREKTLKDGCSSHMTGVAVGALGGYLNFYLSEQDITKRPLA